MKGSRTFSRRDAAAEDNARGRARELHRPYEGRERAESDSRLSAQRTTPSAFTLSQSALQQVRAPTSALKISRAPAQPMMIEYVVALLIDIAGISAEERCRAVSFFDGSA